MGGTYKTPAQILMRIRAGVLAVHVHIHDLTLSSTLIYTGYLPSIKLSHAV